MSDLAAKLAKMRLWRAKWYSWGLDRHAHYDMYRISVGGSGEYHTRISLPSKNIRVLLVERKEQVGAPNSRGLIKTRFRYVEARVEPIPTPVALAKEDYLHTV
jgi:hypothetical protein